MAALSGSTARSGPGRHSRSRCPSRAARLQTAMARPRSGRPLARASRRRFTMTVRVLAVDDEPDVLRLVEIKLRKAGFEVLTARDGQEGLEQAIAEHPDV